MKTVQKSIALAFACLLMLPAFATDTAVERRVVLEECTADNPAAAFPAWRPALPITAAANVAPEDYRFLWRCNAHPVGEGGSRVALIYADLGETDPTAPDALFRLGGEVAQQLHIDIHVPSGARTAAVRFRTGECVDAQPRGVVCPGPGASEVRFTRSGASLGAAPSLLDGIGAIFLTTP